MIELDPSQPIVLDASVGIAIIRFEAPGAEAADVVARHRSAGGRMIVPDHFWLELANILPRRYHASPEQVVAELMAVDGLEMESIRIDRPMLLFALDLQHRHGLSTYDAVYLALAESENARLLTLDARLAAAAGTRTIRLAGFGPHHVAEARAAYGRQPIDWARFGPYLARLRAEARP